MLEDRDDMEAFMINFMENRIGALKVLWDCQETLNLGLDVLVNEIGETETTSKLIFVSQSIMDALGYMSTVVAPESIDFLTEWGWDKNERRFISPSKDTRNLTVDDIINTPSELENEDQC